MDEPFVVDVLALNYLQGSLHVDIAHEVVVMGAEAEEVVEEDPQVDEKTVAMNVEIGVILLVIVVVDGAAGNLQSFLYIFRTHINKMRACMLVR